MVMVAIVTIAVIIASQNQAEEREIRESRYARCHDDMLDTPRTVQNIKRVYRNTVNQFIDAGYNTDTISLAAQLAVYDYADGIGAPPCMVEIALQELKDEYD